MKRGRDHAWKWFFNPVVKKGPNTKDNSQVDQSDEVQAKHKSKNKGRSYMGGKQPDNVRDIQPRPPGKNPTLFPKENREYKQKHTFVHKQMQVNFKTTKK